MPSTEEFILTSPPSVKQSAKAADRLVIMVQAPGPAWRKERPESHQLLEAISRVATIYNGISVCPAWINRQDYPKEAPTLVIVDLDLPQAQPTKIAKVVALGSHAILIGEGRKGRGEGDSDYCRFKSELESERRRMQATKSVQILRRGLPGDYTVLPKLWPKGTSYKLRVAEIADSVSLYVREALRANR